jgi:hypothetical protein
VVLPCCDVEGKSKSRFSFVTEKTAGLLVALAFSEISCFVDKFSLLLIGCVCNGGGIAIRKGFVDKAAAISQLGGNLAHRAPLRSEAAYLGSIHNHTWPSKALALCLRVSEASFHPLHNQRAFQLGHGAQDREHHAARVSVGHESVQFGPPVFCTGDSRVDVLPGSRATPPLDVFPELAGLQGHILSMICGADSRVDCDAGILVLQRLPTICARFLKMGSGRHFS